MNGVPRDREELLPHVGKGAKPHSILQNYFENISPLERYRIWRSEINLPITNICRNGSAKAYRTSLVCALCSRWRSKRELLMGIGHLISIEHGAYYPIIIQYVFSLICSQALAHTSLAIILCHNNADLNILR